MSIPPYDIYDVGQDLSQIASAILFEGVTSRPCCKHDKLGESWALLGCR